MRVKPQLAVVAPPPPLTPEEFADAYERGFTKTVRFLMSKGVNSDTAEEIAQDAWGKGWISLASLLDRRAVLPWINTIALNLFRARLRHLPVSHDVPEQTAPARQTPERFDVGRALESCGPKDRMLLEATAAGYTSSELAALHGTKASTIRVRLMRLRHRVERRWKVDRS